MCDYCRQDDYQRRICFGICGSFELDGWIFEKGEHHSDNSLSTEIYINDNETDVQFAPKINYHPTSCRTLDNS